MIDLLVEERSAGAALRVLVPMIQPGWVEGHDFRIIEFSGKTDLLKQLPKRLLGYHKWKDGPQVLVLVDRDKQDCIELKRRLEEAAASSGLPTKSRPLDSGSFRVVNRIAVEELEAWFFGDPDAICRAYPRVPNVAKKAAYRDPDEVKGGTAEALEKLLRRANYYQSMPKVEVANRIAAHMNPEQNTSKSFNVFREGLLALAVTQEG